MLVIIANIPYNILCHIMRWDFLDIRNERVVVDIINIIGIGEYTVSDNCNDIIKTFALSSCIAVTIYNPYKKIGGMIHIALPSPTGVSTDRGPGFYATTGIPLLIDLLCNKYKCLQRELVINMYGGADSIYKEDIFQIGKRNIEAVLNTLTVLNLDVQYSDTGGFISRTVEMNMDTGNVEIMSQPITI